MSLRPLTNILPRTRRRAVARAVLGALLAWAAVSPADADTLVKRVSGRVEVGRGEPPVWSPLSTGDPVAPSDRIRTGSDGRVELVVDAGTVRVHENSLLRLPSADAATDRVELEIGHSLFDVLKREGRSFEVRTPKVVVSVKGTRFGVEAGSAAGVVSVYRGVVGVRPTEATEVVETLVREGFLATGGGELPIELDVTPSGDPWKRWEDLRNDTSQGAADRPLASELERARTTLRRTTDGEVVKRAAERRPEIADRLRQRSSDSDRDRDARESSRPKDDVPAAPDPMVEPTILEAGSNADVVLEGPRDGDGISIDPSETQRDVVDARRGRLALENLSDAVDVGDITDDALFPNGRTTPQYRDLEGYEANQIMRLVETMESMREARSASPNAWTPNDVSSYLRHGLIQQGMDPAAAARMVQQLFGN